MIPLKHKPNSSLQMHTMGKCNRYVTFLVLLALVTFLLLIEKKPPRHLSREPSQTFHMPRDTREDVIDYANFNDGGKRILVTGAAGFIGMHLALSLANKNNFVVGLDNFNDYYDPDLKRDRAYQLHQHDIPVVAIDICDEERMFALFKKYSFTHVAHLAAQAGVRYSLKNPQAYVKSNVQCFVTLLETVRQFPGTTVVYASSSSVYGRNNKIPFSVNDPIDRPSSLYAATKKADEDIARVYHHLYNIPLTGLRFFTVYGPWGRPDMAVYDFTKKMYNNEAINVYSNGVLQRDFTYIDDIVNGVVAAINRGAEFEIFNLGKGHPERVNELIEIIEEGTHIEAKRNELPLQPGDVTKTFADIDHTYRGLGFRPTTSLEEGISSWIQWFNDYTNYRENGYFEDADTFLQSVKNEVIGGTYFSEVKLEVVKKRVVGDKNGSEQNQKFHNIDHSNLDTGVDHVIGQGHDVKDTNRDQVDEENDDGDDGDDGEPDNIDNHIEDVINEGNDALDDMKENMDEYIDDDDDNNMDKEINLGNVNKIQNNNNNNNNNGLQGDFDKHEKDLSNLEIVDNFNNPDDFLADEMA